MAWFSGVPHPLLNLVIHTHLEERNVDEWIKTILLQAKANGFPLSWWVNPFTTPKSLSDHLKANGFSLVAHFPAMSQDLRVKREEEDKNLDDVRFRRITRKIEANPLGDVIGGAFGLIPMLRQKYLDFAFQDEDNSPFEHYLGFVKGATCYSRIVILRSNN